MNNKKLEEVRLGYLAKYSAKYGVKNYGYVDEGSHYHNLARFPNCHRADFYRDFNARTSESVRKLTPFEGGRLFESRYKEQALVNNEDIEDQFIYTALQPVQDGLCERIGDYPGYNSVWDALNGVERKIKLVRWAEFNEAKRRGKSPKVKDFTDVHILKFERLPGYEHLSQKEYRKVMLGKIEARRHEIVAAWKAIGHKFMTKEELRRIKPGSLPVNPKKSTRFNHYPLVLSKRKETKKEYHEYYFAILLKHRKASDAYRAGNWTVEFPPGTYPPPRGMSKHPPPPEDA